MSDTWAAKSFGNWRPFFYGHAKLKCAAMLYLLIKGGPVVDGTGRVMSTVFAATVGGGERGGYGVPNRIVRRALARASQPVSTGACAH